MKLFVRERIKFGKLIENSSSSFFVDGGLGSGTTITSRWPPVGGPTLGPADTNGGGIDAKHLDVGDMSDVSDVSKTISKSDLAPFCAIFHCQLIFFACLNFIFLTEINGKLL